MISAIDRQPVIKNICLDIENLGSNIRNNIENVITRKIQLRAFSVKENLKLF